MTPADAEGTVTFRLYGPGDTTCSGPAIFTSADRPLDASGVATSASFTPTAVGTYRWIANFVSADTDVFLNSTGVCNAANETSVVTQTTPEISTDALDSDSLPDASISDSATITGLTPDATGNVTFSLYGPGDNTCRTSIWSVDVSINGLVSAGGSVTVSSGNHTVTDAGTYRWIASYEGDAKNAAVAGECNDPNESTVVDEASPTIETSATGGQVPQVSSNIPDTATLTGLTAEARRRGDLRGVGPVPA